MRLSQSCYCQNLTSFHIGSISRSHSLHPPYVRLTALAHQPLFILKTFEKFNISTEWNLFGQRRHVALAVILSLSIKGLIINDVMTLAV